MKRLLKVAAKKCMAGLQKLSPTLVTKILYRRYFGTPLNLKDPKGFHEKLNWLKLNVYKDDPLVCQCVDKYAVRQYVRDRGMEETLVELYGVWETADEIDFDALPEKFVLKCNHGSGSVIICRDKSQLDIADTRQKLNKWLSEDFGAHRAELIYRNVPRKIICEALIETENDAAPNDYKFFCSNGEPKFLFVASGRKGVECYQDYFDMQWNHYPITNDHTFAPGGVAKPENFDEMVSTVRALAGDFPMVRVDLYNEKGKIYFGELTFLHGGGLHPFEPRVYERILGDMMELDITKHKK